MNQIFINSCNNKLISIEVQPSDTIEGIKSVIADKSDMHVETFYLSHSGKLLANDKTMDDYGISNNNILNLHMSIIGGGIVGTHAGELISEIALAIEMSCDVADIALTIHPHPTLSESVMMAAEIFEGTITDLYLPRKTNSSLREGAHRTDEE